jgi:hypothetical protein
MFAGSYSKFTFHKLFQLLLQQDVLKQDDCIRILAITLFSLYHIKSGGADDLEEFDCISKDDEVN